MSLRLSSKLDIIFFSIYKLFVLSKYTFPIDKDFQEILKTHIEAKRKRNGENYSQAAIRDWVNAIKSFYEWARNADIQTAETEDIPTKSESPTVDSKQKSRRPKSSGRTEKFTLYVRPETWQNLKILADYDELTITELMNNILENYFTSRADDLEFLTRI